MPDPWKARELHLLDLQLRDALLAWLPAQSEPFIVDSLESIVVALPLRLVAASLEALAAREEQAVRATVAMATGVCAAGEEESAPWAAPLLRRLASDPSPGVRVAALAAFSLLGGGDA